MEKKHLHIAAGIIRNAQQQIFITERPDGTHMAGFWEFPGGKLEKGEEAEEALVRELEEEVGIIVTESQLFHRVDHEFDDRFITLYFFIVSNWDNEPYGKEGQKSRWIEQKDLVANEFPPANRVIVDMLTK
ncbi:MULTISPECIES: 8-oxo-dGTP diphosphatase MutT [Providencia]|uniref:8-oxo-dGTP diphosphatase n=1 Tax=Providencia heimbachae ATCC 35613 TaxID=1354272 RepID=A0A1B7JKG9_9GAMM|nr:8-oxo-dGTP diphosphatase MutT [Providencia heimbachae]MBP6121748.1 8-oxo-dGTP diphosphatase MutT [Providencia sp.]NIH22008.1 8-oxo-dGTP diphosphatase MutT [Providencia heimbachae]OAT48395.1 MutT family mutator protein [Providencia heimbachae ATCC 35613]QCJ69489.1 8-oxo-dGTP diphosphatase MutT [Providencia heimbachae]SQH12562.1 8-oxo-dGTP diphosphatase [Providencia heimbachae]